jgi:predicted transcriptional regulator
MSEEQSKSDGKQAMSIRLSAEGRRLLAALSQQKGISRTAVIELAIRAYAKQEHVE